MPGIERYLGVRAATSPTYSGATGQWYFLMNLTDTFQVYGMAGPGAWPNMLTDYAERVSGVHAAPNRSIVILTRDKGADEHHQLYRMNLETMAVEALTHDLGAVHLFGAFSPDGKKFAYTSTARNGQDYDVYLMSMDTPSARPPVLTRQGHWEVLEWTEDDRLLLREVRGNADQALYQWDLASGEVKRLTPDDQLAVYHDAHFASNGTLYTLTDHGRDFINLARLDQEGHVDYLIREAADVDAMALTRQGRLIAYSVNREGFSELHLYEVDSGARRHVQAFDDSVIFDLVFNEEGTELAVTHSGPDHNMNIALVHLSSGEVKPLTLAPMTGLDSKQMVRPNVMRYQSFDGLSIPAHVYCPPGIGDAPVVVSVHGGPEAQERPYFSAWYQYLLAHGYAVVTPNVRGSTGYGKAYSHLDDREQRMDSVRDIAHLVDWIQDQPGLDGSRIAIYGGSYGGFMVLSSITQYPERFRVAIDIVGIANLESFLENTSAWRRALREVEYGYLATDREFLRRFSPIHYVDRIKTPLFVVHGANDPRVPLNEAEQIVQALKERGREVEFCVFDDEGHGIAKLKNRLTLYPRMVDFLDRYLKD